MLLGSGLLVFGLLRSVYSSRDLPVAALVGALLRAQRLALQRPTSEKASVRVGSGG